MEGIGLLDLNSHRDDKGNVESMEEGEIQKEKEL